MYVVYFTSIVYGDEVLSISFKEILAMVTVFDEYAILRFILAMFQRVRESTEKTRQELATFSIRLIQGK